MHEKGGTQICISAVGVMVPMHAVKLTYPLAFRGSPVHVVIEHFNLRKYIWYTNNNTNLAKILYPSSCNYFCSLTKRNSHRNETLLEIGCYNI